MPPLRGGVELWDFGKEACLRYCSAAAQTSSRFLNAVGRRARAPGSLSKSLQKRRSEKKEEPKEEEKKVSFFSLILSFHCLLGSYSSAAREKKEANASYEKYSSALRALPVGVARNG